MLYLIDTDVIIDFQNKKEPGFTYFQTAVKKGAFISVISYSEIVFGIQKFSHKQKVFEKFENMLEDFGISVIPIDKQIGSKYAELKYYLQKKRDLLPDFDLVIAAQAVSNDLALVSRNIKHFSRIPGLNLYKP